MPDVQTTASALSNAITFKVQTQVLKNLRAALVFADPAYAMRGTFDAGTDTLVWVDVPDLPINTTPLVEGTRPNKRALTLNTVTTATTEYGDLVAITNLAKTKSPIELVPIATEHLSRQATETLDQINRDALASGGTPFYPTGSVNVTRADIAANEKATVPDMRVLRAKMFNAKIPLFPDGFYRLFVSAAVGLDIKSDAAFQAAYQYVDNTPLLSGEIGRIAGFRVIEVVNAPTFASTTTVHASIAVGALNGWGIGELDSLRVFHVAPGGDHVDPLAQEELLGWRVNFGVAVLKNAFYFRYETAATAV